MKKNKILPNFCSKNISVKADGFLEVRRCDSHVVQTSEAPDAGRNFCRRRNRSRGRKVLSRHFHRWRFHFGKPTKNGTKHDSGERHSWRWVHQKLNLLIFKEIAKWSPECRRIIQSCLTTYLLINVLYKIQMLLCR